MSAQGRLFDWRDTLDRSELGRAGGGLVVDLFAGGGGASAGLESALGRPVDIAINHDPVALAVHRANHPDTRHLEADIWEVRPTDATEGRPVAVLWASPDCTHFSCAKGGVPRKQDIRSLAWAVVRWAKATRPRVIFLENVREFSTWGPLGKDGTPDPERMGLTFKRWAGTLRGLGYHLEARCLDSADYGVPTRRRRLFVIARLDGQPIRWPEPTHGKGRQPFRTAAECIDWSLACPSIFDRERPLAEKTLARIAEGLRRYVLESPRPFIVDGAARLMVQRSWGEREGQSPRCLDIEQPLGTVVAGGLKHALVSAFLAKHYGGVIGTRLDAPIGTVTAKDHHSLTAATLIKLRGQCHGADIEQPMPTLTAGGTHVAQVRAFLTAFYGSDGTVGKGQRLDVPMRVLTAKARLGLVTVAGVEYQVTDIGMRMLQPHELLRAQFGTFAGAYDMGRATTKTDQIRLIGNSVCPEVARALVAANMPDQGEEMAA